jgi:sec-independent protein translocase protein TatA
VYNPATGNDTPSEAFNGGRGLVFTGLESPTHLIIVLVIVLLLFGAKRIPELAKGLAAGIREFKKGAQGDGDAELHEASDEREEHTPR